MPLNLFQSLQTRKIRCKKCKQVISVPVGMDIIECDGKGEKHEVTIAESEGD